VGQSANQLVEREAQYRTEAGCCLRFIRRSIATPSKPVRRHNCPRKARRRPIHAWAGSGGAAAGESERRDFSMKGAVAIFRFLVDAARRGERTALVTLAAVEGSSSRAVGTQMAVTESGTFAGSLSGGCVEAAVVGDARRIIESGRAEIVRFGAGSRYIDIRLPCGGGIDLLFTPDPPLSVLDEALDTLMARQPVELALGLEGAVAIDGLDETGWPSGRFHVRHDPDLRLVIVGHGAETDSLARLARAHGADTRVLSPDRELVENLIKAGFEAFCAPDTDPFRASGRRPLDRHRLPCFTIMTGKPR
jgi:xanthine/CO dehydrogenase XdhC/CoxF family maturation factor